MKRYPTYTDITGFGFSDAEAKNILHVIYREGCDPWAAWEYTRQNKPGAKARATRATFGLPEDETINGPLEKR